MKMLKTAGALLCFVLLLAVLFFAGGMAETDIPAGELYGYITEVTDGGFLMKDEGIGAVLLRVDPETVLEGVLAETSLKKDMYVYVRYNGILTRSRPPQAHADRLGCYMLSGRVEEILSDGVLLAGDRLFDPVFVSLNVDMTYFFNNMPLTVYYDGTMAMGMPGRVTARSVEMPVLQGIVQKTDETSLVLAIRGGDLLTVVINEDTALPANWRSGNLVGRNLMIYHEGDPKKESEGTIALRAFATINPVSGELTLACLEESGEADLKTIPDQDGPDESGSISTSDQGFGIEELKPTASPESSVSPAPAEDVPITEANAE